ncbi:MAG: DUF4258 domain-containing protein [Rubrivivax sp.]
MQGLARSPCHSLRPRWPFSSCKLQPSRGILCMGYSRCQKKTDRQLEKQIRESAKVSVNVFITVHARQQMAKRRILRAEVDDCIARGTIRRTPEPNPARGSLECRLDAYVAGRNLAVIVAISDEDPSLVVVTAMVSRK